MKAVLLPPFLTKAVVLDGQTSLSELLNILTAKISECGSKAAANEPYRKEEDEYEEDKETTRKKKYRELVARKETDNITANYDDVLELLQAVARRVAANPLLLQAENCARE